MKKLFKTLVVAIALLAASSSFAAGYGPHHGHVGHYGIGRGAALIVPSVILGGMIGYGIARQYYAPPVVAPYQLAPQTLLYCDATQSYYYVQPSYNQGASCSTGWREVYQ